MAIERMKSVLLFAPHGRARDLLDHLAGIGLSHISDCGPAGAEHWEKLGIARVYPDAADIEQRVRLLREILETFNTYHRTSRQFLENFITTPVEVRSEEVHRALAELDIEQMHTDVKSQERHHDTLASAYRCADGHYR